MPGVWRVVDPRSRLAHMTESPEILSLSEAMKEILQVEGVPFVSIAAVGYTTADGREGMRIAYDGLSIAVEGLAQKIYFRLSDNVLTTGDDDGEAG